MGPKVIIRFWWNLTYRLRPETISPLFADLSSTTHVRLCSAIVHFCPKQLSLLCLLWLFSASADRIGCFATLCSMIELWHELKNSNF